MGDIHATAQDDDTPYFKWKTAVLWAQSLIDDTSMAQKTADYNLLLFNRLTDTISATVLGDPKLLPYKVITILAPNTIAINHTPYFIYSAEHRFSKDGYTTALELRGV